MTLKLYDTLQRKKVEFKPRDLDTHGPPTRDRPVTLYVCGPTVYSYAHIGNARPVVVFDVLYRLLRRLYGEDAVRYARNVTDIDDKIIAAAVASNRAPAAVAAEFAEAYRADMRALNALPPTEEPFATDHIEAMASQIKRLIDGEFAYVADGNVLFRVQRFARYGALSGRSLDDMIAGARVDVASYKEDPADFILWKPSKPGEPSWDVGGNHFPPGRPGWHIECSGMIEQVLGLPVDIHGGGHDLIFPHHTNEIAQGCCAVGATDPTAYARHWMHNGFLTMDAEKMSKSLGNVQTVHGLLERWPGEVIRWALLSAHYRAPLDWTDALLEQSRKALDGLYGMLQRARDVPRVCQPELAPRHLAELLDDLNTPAAIAQLFSLKASIDQHIDAGGDAVGAKSAFVAIADALGVLQQDPEAWFGGSADASLRATIDGLIASRAEARRAKDWPAADRIRDKLAALNVEVLDGAGGAVSWRMRG